MQGKVTFNMECIMKTTITALLAMLTASFSFGGEAGEYTLLPLPRSIEYARGFHALSGKRRSTHTSIDPRAVPREHGYRLVIAKSRIDIVAHDKAGAFYAEQTLRQILKQAADGKVRCLEINDWPDFPVRGVLLDISRNKVPTMESLYAFIDLLASWKINQLQFYTERAFAYKDHKAVWEGTSPMTAEQIRALDIHCKGRHIDLVPNQNSFGHLDRWLWHDDYKHLAEAIEPVETEWGTFQRFSLCPIDPDSIKFLAGLYDELLPNFSSPYFNVCLDETIELGKGRSKSACEERGKGRVYLDFLLKIHKEVVKRHKIMMMWGDIIIHHPELIGELPKDIIVLTWGYEADFDFDGQLAKFAKAGLKFYVCPGTSTWNSIAGRTDNALENLRSAAENGIKHGASGFLNTEWGDNGHWQPLSVDYLPFAYGASVGWAYDANREIDTAKALDTFVFEDKAGIMGRLVYDLGNAYKVCGVKAANWSPVAALIMAPQVELTDWRLNGLTAGGLEATLCYIDKVMARLPEARMQSKDADLIAEELELAANMLRHACRFGIARIENGRCAIGDLPQETRTALADDLKPIIAEHRRLWVVRNRKGGLDESAGRLESLLRAYKGQ